MSGDALEGNIGSLKLRGIIGFDGNTINGLKIHPDGVHLLYPLGNKVAISNVEQNMQYFLSGHTNVVSALDVSKSGKYVASGQINHIGFKAAVILWSFEKKEMIAKHELHKVRVESVMFTFNDKYLVSLGGRDCGNLIIYDMDEALPLCGGQASKGTEGYARTICATNRRTECFITGGDTTLTVWQIDKDARQIHGTEVNVSKIKRVINCIAINERDEMAYCGTSTGDIMKIILHFHHDVDVLEPVKQPKLLFCYGKVTPDNLLSKGIVNLYSLGVRALILGDKDEMLVGAGDGSVELVQMLAKPQYARAPVKLPTNPQLRTLKATNVRSAVTSMEKYETMLLIGTKECEVFSVDLATWEVKLLVTCHHNTIFDIAFPYMFSDVFATAGKENVRIWNLSTLKELLRIQVPNFACSSVVFTYDGKNILTGWNDGIIRSFTPLTGKLIYAILNTHNKGVSALAVTKDGKMIVSGGCEGQVRLWDITPYKQQLKCVLKEHEGPVSAVQINQFNDEAVSASTDGTCIIWDIVRMVRKQILFANTLFMTVRYFPTGVQILTGGSDRKIAYWEVIDGSLIRELEGSSSSAINCLELSPSGDLFVTGGNDELVKLWKYQEGIVTHIGTDHSAVITAITFSPDGKSIVSCSAAGSIFIWENPFADGLGATDTDSMKQKKGVEEKGDEGASSTPGKGSARGDGASGRGSAEGDTTGGQRGLRTPTYPCKCGSTIKYRCCCCDQSKKPQEGSVRCDDAKDAKKDDKQEGKAPQEAGPSGDEGKKEDKKEEPKTPSTADGGLEGRKGNGNLSRAQGAMNLF